jgi:ketosteroid isomerase-like protein
MPKARNVILASLMLGGVAGAFPNVSAAQRPAHDANHAKRPADHHALPSDSTDVLAVLNRFHAALASGDSAAAISLLLPDVKILESGSLETLADYRSHHLAADIAFAKAVPSTRTVVSVNVVGTAAWVVSTSISQGQSGGRPVNSAGAELMVLKKAGPDWKISAIHWSSRRRPTGG